MKSGLHKAFSKARAIALQHRHWLVRSKLDVTSKALFLLLIYLFSSDALQGNPVELDDSICGWRWGSWNSREYLVRYHIQRGDSDNFILAVADPKVELKVRWRGELRKDAQDQWRLYWATRDGPRQSNPIKLIQTLQGPCLVANFLEPTPSGRELWHWSMIYLEELSESPAAFRDRIKPLPEIAETDNYDLVRWTSSNDLAANSVRNIAQTDDGFIWIATTEGMSRFDGADWTPFDSSSKPPLPDKYVMDLLSLSDGALAIATKNEGIYRFRGHQFAPVLPSTTSLGGTYNCLIETSDGALWCTAESGQQLCRVDIDGGLSTWKLHDLTGVEHAYRTDTQVIGDLMAMPDSKVLATSSVGPLLFDPVTESVTFLFPATNTHVMSLLPHSDEQFFLGLGGATLLMNTDLTIAEAFLPPEGLAVGLWTRDGRRFLSGVGGLAQWKKNGLVRFRGVRESFQLGITSLLEDHEGNIWITSATDGVGRLRPRTIEAVQPSPAVPGFHQPQAIQATPDGSVVMAANGFVFTLQDGEMTRKELSSAFFARHPSLDSNALSEIIYHHSMALSPTNPDEHWYGLGMRGRENPKRVEALGSINAPLIAKEANGQFTFYTHPNYPQSVHSGSSIAMTRSGDVWYATEQGVFRLRNDRLSHWSEFTSIPVFEASAVFVDDQDHVWLGSYRQGVVRVANETYHHYRKEGDQLASDRVLSIHQSETDSSIWLGGDHGITRIHGESITSITADRVPNSPIHSLLQDIAGDYWLGTSKGLYYAKEGELMEALEDPTASPQFLQFGRREGLPNEAIYPDYHPVGCRTPDGNLYYCLLEGLAHFSPSDVLRGAIGPKMRITRVEGPANISFHEDTHSFNNDTRLTLPQTAQTAFTIGFNALSYAYPSETQYQYRVIELQDEWIDTRTQRTALLFGMAPGDYTFQVRGIGYNGASSPSPAKLKLRISPYFYQTETFRALVLIGIGLAIWGAHFWRMVYRDQIRALEQQVAMEAERTRIARDLHDELGSGLAKIRLLSDMASDTPAAIENMKAALSRVSTLTRECADGLRDVIWSLNPERDQIQDLGDYWRSAILNYFSDSPIQTRVVIDDAVASMKLSPWTTRQLIFCSKGIMSNVLRHSEATQFEISATRNEHELLIRFQDNGIGFDPNEAERRGTGLKSLHKRSTDLGGSLTITSAPGHGTKIALTVPTDLEPAKGGHRS